MHRVLTHLRAHVIPYTAVGMLVLGVGGGYAIAAGVSNTINACVVKKTGELLIKSKCGHGQRRLSWNRVGPQGPRGFTGQTGPAGQAPPSAWATVAGSGPVLVGSGIQSTRSGPGTYQISVTAPACAGKVDSSVVTPMLAPVGGSFPVATVSQEGTGPFTVFTGVVTNGVFTPSDMTFHIQAVCE
jgi:hypothetical protein